MPRRLDELLWLRRNLQVNRVRRGDCTAQVHRAQGRGKSQVRRISLGFVCMAPLTMAETTTDAVVG